MSGLVIILLVLVQGAASSKHLWNNSGHLKNATCCPSQAESDVMTWHDGTKRAGHMFGIESHQVESSLDQMLSSVGPSTNCSGRYTCSHEVSLLQCYCMTYGKHTDELVVGFCFYG